MAADETNLTGHPITYDRLKELLVIVPAAHIFLCFVYLFFYQNSFGSGVWLFSSPTDVFSVSISDVAPAYIFMSAGLAVGLILFSEPTTEGASTSERQEMPKTPLYVKLSVVSLALYVIASVIMLIVIWIRTGFFVYTLVMPVAMFVLGYMSSVLTRGLFGGHKTATYVVLFAVMAIAMTALNGLGDGQKDRSVDYANLSQQRPRCADKVVIRTVSANYLAVLKDNSRVIIGEDCKVKFVVIHANEFHRFPDGTAAEIAFGN